MAANTNGWGSSPSRTERSDGSYERVPNSPPQWTNYDEGQQHNSRAGEEVSPPQQIRSSLQSVKEAAVRLQVLLSRTTPPRRGSRGTPRRGGRTNHRGDRGRLPNKYEIQMVTVTKVMGGGSRPGRRLRKWLREHGRSLNRGVGSLVGGIDGQMMPAPNGTTAQDLDGRMTETVILTHPSGTASQFHCSHISAKSKFGKPRRRWIQHVVDLGCSAG